MKKLFQRLLGLPDRAAADTGTDAQAVDHLEPVPGAQASSDPQHLFELSSLKAAEAALEARDLSAADALLTPLAERTTHPAALVSLSKIRMVQGRHDEALALLKRAESAHPLDRSVWDTLAEWMKVQRQPADELVYRRKLAFASAQPGIQAFTELVRTLASVAAATGGASLDEIRLASKQVAALDQGEPRAHLEFAETLYRIDGMQAEALDHYRKVSPCPPSHREVSARWSALDPWCAKAGATLHRLSEEGVPGMRPRVAQLRDVTVLPSLQWIPVLDEGRVAIEGFQVSRMRLHSEVEASPILMNGHGRLELRVPRDVQVIDTPAILLGGLPQYYHHTIDHVSRLAHVEALNLGAGLPLVVNADLQAFQLEHLALLGYAQDRLIRVKAGEAVRFRELLVPTPLVRGGQWMDPLIPRWYRQRLAPTGGARAPSRRLYLSRGQAPRRQIVNEAELVRLLVAHGYEIVQPENFSVAAQIAMFSEASHVVCPSGAALTNMVYMPPGARIVSLYSRYLQTGVTEFYFDALAKACGHQFSVVLGDVQDLRGVERAGDANFVVDASSLRAVLD